METNYALKREKTIWLKWLQFCLVAFFALGFLAHSQAQNVYYQKANDPVKNSVTTATTITICAEDPAIIGVQNSTLGLQYRLKRNGGVIGFIVGDGTPYKSFGSFSTPGLYTVDENDGVWAQIPAPLTLDNFFVLPDTTRIFHAGNPADPQFFEHYICEWYTNAVYTVDSGAINDALIAAGCGGIAPQGITWIVTAWDTACNTFNLSTTGQGTSQILVYWFEAVRGRVRAQLETTEGCVFYTQWKYVYIFREPFGSYALVDPDTQEPLPDTIHYCGNLDADSIGLDGAQRYEVCVPSGVGFPAPIDQLDGYWYFLYEFGQKVDSVIPDFDGQQIKFAIGSDNFDTIFYTIFGYPIHHADGLIEQPLPYCGEFIASITVIRDLEPVADAGDDLEVCGDACTTLDASPGVPEVARAENFDYWWTYDGPGTLTFTPDGDSNAVVCREECDVTSPFGIYTLWFNVINGQCDDSDDMQLTFLESPVAAVADDDQEFCDQACFTIEALPYSFCGVFGENFDNSGSHWEFVSGPQTVTFGDPLLTTQYICLDDQVCFEGLYHFQWIEVNHLEGGTIDCTDTIDVYVTIYEDPTGVSAGDDFAVCEGDTYQLAGTGHTYVCQLDGSADVSYLWEADQENPCVVTIANDDMLATDITFSGDCCYGLFTFYLTETNGTCEVTSEVVVTRYEEPTADAGANFSLCGDDVNGMEAELTGVPYMYCADTYTDVSFMWAADPLNPCAVEFADDAAAVTTVLFTDGCACPWGVYTFWLTEINGECQHTDYVEVTRYEPPTGVDAGTDGALCQTDGSVYNLVGTGHNYCTADGTVDYAYLWTPLTSNPCEVEFADDASLVTDVTFSGDCCFGIFGFVLTETNGDCSEDDTVFVTRYEKPEVDAGENDSFCGNPDGDSYALCATPSDYCTDVTGVYSWTADAGNPCTVVFADDAAACTDVFFSNELDCCAYGVYTFYFNETNGECSDEDYVVITRFEPPSESISAGDDADVCDVDCYSLEATPTADYCQDADSREVAYLWTVDGFTNPGLVTFTNPTGASTDVCFEVADCAYGPYMFRFIETNGDCEAYVDVTITRYEQPIADAGPDFCECIDDATSYMYSTIQFAANAYDFCYTENNCSKWTKSDGPGQVVFDDITAPDANVTFSVYGCYTFTWTECNPACADSSDMVVCWLEDPIASSEFEADTADCGTLSYDLTDIGINKYMYMPAPHVSWDNAMWTQIAGPGTATFVDPASHTSVVDVDAYGCYTFRWTESNSSPFSPCDANLCEDFVEVNICFFEEPTATAGEDAIVCGTCYTLEAIPFVYMPAPSENEGTYYWEIVDGGPCAWLADDTAPVTSLCISNCEECYGDYTLVWHEINGNCEATDTVMVNFGELPVETPLHIWGDDANYCGDYLNARANINDCIMPMDTTEVCAYSCQYFEVPFYEAGTCPDTYLDDCGNPIPYLREGWTYEWSVIGPNGTTFEATPGYYDFGAEQWHYPTLSVCWGECCEIGTVYLTITTPNCVVTYPYYFQINHTPDATIAGPDVAEVSTEYAYSVPENDCALYNWRVEFCGEIVSGQGTNEIVVHWTDYAENGGVGIIEVQILDTCTGCCGEGEFLVDVFPTGSFGDGTLSGNVTYDNTAQTPLNGVHLMLYNGDVMIAETWSFNDVDGGGAGYFEFTGLNEVTSFQLVADYDAPWFGANATDALAIQLKILTIEPIVWDALNTEAGDANASGGLTSTDALWVMQRAIYMVNMFPAGDWVFGDATTTDMMTTTGTYDVSALNYGDVNRSNVPSGAKDATAITLVKDGVLNVTKGEEFELPIRVADAIELGAVTLHATVNSELIEIVDVTGFEGALRSTVDNRFSVAWSSTNAINLANDDAVIIVKAIALDDISSDADLFNIELGTEFAYANADVVGDLTLKTFGVTTEVAPAEYSLGYNRPNPFSSTTEITYALPEAGKVRLSVMNVYGTEITVIAEGTQTAGTYTVTFSSAGLNAGVYLYKLIVDGETSDFVETRRMVISH